MKQICLFPIKTACACVCVSVCVSVCLKCVCVCLYVWFKCVTKYAQYKVKFIGPTNYKNRSYYHRQLQSGLDTGKGKKNHFSLNILETQQNAMYS